ncbi:MAG: GntP family permease [Thermoguttaceae bacterium]|nr:GntP family permease [Thermoguttaceae bacterium]
MIFAQIIGKRVKSADERSDGATNSSPDAARAYEEFTTTYGKLPGAAWSFAPIVVPIVLMALATISTTCAPFASLGGLGRAIEFLGKPFVALGVGFLVAIALLTRSGRLNELSDLTNDALKTVGPILFVTAAGGVLGAVVAAGDAMRFISENCRFIASLGVFFPFLLAAILKTAQGSSTVAMTTAAAAIAPTLPQLGLDSTFGAALATVAIGAGATTVSHANDSFFWIVVNFGELSAEDGWRAQTLGTLIVGAVSILTIFMLSFAV